MLTGLGSQSTLALERPFAFVPLLKKPRFGLLPAMGFISKMELDEDEADMIEEASEKDYGGRTLLYPGRDRELTEERALTIAHVLIRRDTTVGSHSSYAIQKLCGRVLAFSSDSVRLGCSRPLRRSCVDHAV
jgi:hypothetical protein